MCLLFKNMSHNNLCTEKRISINSQVRTIFRQQSVIILSGLIDFAEYFRLNQIFMQ